MIDLAQIRERVALGRSDESTMVDLSFLAQVAAEIEAGRAAARELALLRRHDGMIFGRPRPGDKRPTNGQPA